MSDPAPLPPPPRPRGSRGARPRAPQRRTLSREAIADAAMAILEREGLDRLTMRAVAAALGTGAASLYAHVANKDDLVAILVDRAAAEMQPLPEPDPGRWEEQARLWCRRMRESFERHPNLARATLGTIPTGENALTATEWLIGLLRAAGIPDQIVAYTCDLLPLYVGAVCFEEGIEFAERGDAGMDAYVSEIGEYFASLPRERFPNLLAILGAMMRNEGDERFEFGLDVILAGIAARIPGP